MARLGEGTDPLKCSFCGKGQKQVKKLIAGPEVYICDECVELCNEILDEEFFEGKDKESEFFFIYFEFQCLFFLSLCSSLFRSH